MRYLSPLLTLVVLLLSLASSAETQAQSAERCFPETGHCISGAIRAYWERNGGLAVFGYPISPLRDEDNGEGFRGPTQWFERDRLEDHGAAGVMAGRLGARKLEVEGRPWQGLPQVDAAPSGCRYFSETRHSLCPPFLSYWERNGGLERFGYPISEPQEERVGDWSGSVQWFERRRMEYHPELPAAYTVSLGLLGNELLVSSANPVAAPPAELPNGDLIGRLLARVNMYRQQAGCPALTLHPQLTAAAQSHSQDMAQNNFTGHIGSDGSNPRDRIERAGYNYSSAGENIAIDIATPEEVVDRWVNQTPPNDGHRRNVLNCNYLDTGIGYVAVDTPSGRVRHFWTQIYGRQ